MMSLYASCQCSVDWSIISYIYRSIGRINIFTQDCQKYLIPEKQVKPTYLIGNNSLCFIQGSSNSHAIKKKDELERVAKSNR